MARRKLPAAVLKGNTYSKSELEQLQRIEEEMLGFDDALDEVPEQLDDIGRIYYEYILNNLRETKIPICNLDKNTIILVADALSNIYKCQLDIKKRGLLVVKTERNGAENLAPNPSIKIMHDFENKYIQLSSQLGMTPSARSTLASMQLEQKAEDEDEVLNILKELKK